MRIFTILALAATLTACQQRTETNTVADTSGTTQTKTTTVTTTVPEVSVDTAATAAAKKDVQEAGHTVAEGARKAAHATGTALEKAGKEVQKRTSDNDKH